MRSPRWILLFALFVLPFSMAQEHAAPAVQTSAVAAAGHASAEKDTVSAEQIWADLMQGNQRFVAGKPQVRELQQLRHTLAGGQHPKVIVLACSDSRVAPELLFDKTLGDLFVVRAAGNIADAIGLGSMEYAVEHLGSSMLVVLGHETCGAVTAACSEEKMPSPNLQAMVDKIEPAVRQAKRYAKPGDVVPTAILENVHQSASDVLANSEILRHALKDGHLTIIEAVYRLDSGEVVRLGKPPALQ
jgi:carbonic anhydrase